MSRHGSLDLLRDGAWPSTKSHNGVRDAGYRGGGRGEPNERMGIKSQGWACKEYRSEGVDMCKATGYWGKQSGIGVL